MNARPYGMCSPGAAGFVGWRVDQLELLIKPTEAQRSKFAELRTASNKASEVMRLACPTELPTPLSDGWRRWKNAWMQCCKRSKHYDHP